MTTSTPLVTGVDFITVPTRDLPAAKEFYGNVLGLTCSAEYETAPGAEFETDSLTLQLIDSDVIGREFLAHKFPIALHVEDVPAARAELESRGVSFQQPTIDSGVCHMAFFEDPEGNAFMLHNRYAPRTPA